MPFFELKPSNDNLNSNNNICLRDSSHLRMFEKNKKFSLKSTNSSSMRRSFSMESAKKSAKNRNSLCFSVKKLKYSAHLEANAKKSAQSSFFSRLMSEISGFSTSLKKKSSKSTKKLERHDQIKELIELLLKNPLVLEHIHQIVNSPNIELLKNLLSKDTNLNTDSVDHFKDQISGVIKTTLNDFFQSKSLLEVRRLDSDKKVIEHDEIESKPKPLSTKISEKVKKFDNFIKENQSKEKASTTPRTFYKRSKFEQTSEFLGFKRNLDDLISRRDPGESFSSNRWSPKVVDYMVNRHTRNISRHSTNSISSQSVGSNSKLKSGQQSESNVSAKCITSSTETPTKAKTSRLLSVKDSLTLLKTIQGSKLDEDSLSTNTNNTSMFQCYSDVSSMCSKYRKSVNDLIVKKVNFQLASCANEESCDSQSIDTLLSFLVTKIDAVRHENQIPKSFELMSKEQLVLEESCLASVLIKLDSMCESSDRLRANKNYLELKNRLEHIKTFLSSF